MEKEKRCLKKEEVEEIDFSESSVVFAEAIEEYSKVLHKLASEHNCSFKGQDTLYSIMLMPVMSEWQRATKSEDTHIIGFFDYTDLIKDYWHEKMGKPEHLTPKRRRQLNRERIRRNFSKMTSKKEL